MIICFAGAFARFNLSSAARNQTNTIEMRCGGIWFARAAAHSRRQVAPRAPKNATPDARRRRPAPLTTRTRLIHRRRCAGNWDLGASTQRGGARNTLRLARVACVSPVCRRRLLLWRRMQISEGGGVAFARLGAPICSILVFFAVSRNLTRTTTSKSERFEFWSWPGTGRGEKCLLLLWTSTRVAFVTLSAARVSRRRRTCDATRRRRSSIMTTCFLAANTC